MFQTFEQGNAPLVPVHPLVVAEEVDERAECYNCENRIEDVHYRDGNEYCDECYDDLFFFSCSDCNDMTDINEKHYDDGDELCYSCNRQREEDRENEEELPERQYTTKNLAEFQSRTVGEFIKSSRIFSAEIECYYGEMSEMQDAAEEIPRGFGITSDGSLKNDGVEFQTPKLKGKQGELAIKHISKVLNAHGFHTDRTTGLHIHLDGRGLMPKTRTKTYPAQLVRMLSFYLSFEEVILSFLPASRRKNQFCNPLRNSYHVQEIRDVRNLEQLEKIWYRRSLRRHLKEAKSNKYHQSRYAGINLHSLLKDGHIEVRYHSGTMNATKILEWVNLHQTVLDMASMKHSRLDERCSEAMAMTNLEEKTELFFDVLNLPARAREYFRSRQAAFTSTRADNGEEASQNELCAE